MAETNGSTGENQNSRRLDQMQAVIQSMIDLTHEQMKQSQEVLHVIRESHLMFMEEARELIILQKEQRIDIMPLFQSQKNIRERMDKIDGGNEQ